MNKIVFGFLALCFFILPTASRAIAKTGGVPSYMCGSTDKVKKSNGKVKIYYGLTVIKLHTNAGEAKARKIASAAALKVCHEESNRPRNCTQAVCKRFIDYPNTDSDSSGDDSGSAGSGSSGSSDSDDNSSSGSGSDLGHTSQFCTYHPMEKGCPQFCTYHPMDSSCTGSTGTYCTYHPMEKGCPQFCTYHPMDSSCTGSTGTYCTYHPMEPGCPQFCTYHPMDPSCTR